MVRKPKTLNFKRGVIFVIEGVDGVGKSELCKKIVSALEEKQIKSTSVHFPGKNTETLGGEVYRIHHDPNLNKGIPPISLQMLHIAAHIDSWENKIEGLLVDGFVVLLDRCLWSTYAYGKLQNIDDSDLFAIINIEKKHYKEDDILHYFYVKNTNIKIDKNVEKYYLELIDMDYEYKIKTSIVDNNFNDDNAFEYIKTTIFEYLEL